MLNIVVVGATSLGRHLAMILSKENHNIVVVDKDKKKLEELSWNTDVAIRQGDPTDWQLLDDLLELFPDLLLALTENDETNLVASSIAKQLGYPQAIARVQGTRFLNRTRLDFARLFFVDHFIAPEILAANEMMKSIASKGALAVEHFAHGAVQLCTLLMPQNWQKFHVPLMELDLPEGIRVGLILRKSQQGENLIFPHGQDLLLPGDEVTFIGETEAMDKIYKYCGILEKKIHSVVLIGGSSVAFHLAKLLGRREIPVRIIEKDYDRCLYLAEHLPEATILNQNVLDLEFLKSEKISETDLVAICEDQDEKNLMSGMLVKEVGAQNVLILLSNLSYQPLLEKLKIGYTISPLIIAENRILSHIFTEKVTSLISLYGNRAEVLEIKVSMDSKMVGIPISDLASLFPKDFLIAMIQNRGRIMIAHGSRIISPGDTVIVITRPKHVAELEDMF